MPKINDEELLERYQEAWVHSRQLRKDALRARELGFTEVLGEYTMARLEGCEAAYGWLIEQTPIAPVTGVPTAVSPETIACELAAIPVPTDEMLRPAEQMQERGDPSSPHYPKYLEGVREALTWQIRRLAEAS